MGSFGTSMSASGPYATWRRSPSIREQKLSALSRVKQIQTLFDVSRKLSATSILDDIAWIVATQVSAGVKGQSIILLKRDDDIAIASGVPPEDTLGAADWAAARWTMQRGESAGWATSTLPNATFQFRPLSEPNPKRTPDA